MSTDVSANLMLNLGKDRQYTLSHYKEKPKKESVHKIFSDLSDRFFYHLRTIGLLPLDWP